MASDTLAGARLKLARAEEHFDQLRTEQARFLERNPYRALRETDVRPNCFVWRIKIVEEPPCDQWAILVGECVHALRSALDHVAFGLVQLNRPGSDFSEFPIFKDRASWDANHMKKLPGVDPKVITQAKWLQPYRRFEDKDPLWVVHTLDILDKHRRLHLVSATLDTTNWRIEGGELKDIDPCLGPFKDGAIVGRFRIDAPVYADVRVYTQFVFDIAFEQGEPAGGQYVLHILEWARVYVGGVISRFERWLR